MCIIVQVVIASLFIIIIILRHKNTTFVSSHPLSRQRLQRRCKLPISHTIREVLPIPDNGAFFLRDLLVVTVAAPAVLLHHRHVPVTLESHHWLLRELQRTLEECVRDDQLRFLRSFPKNRALSHLAERFHEQGVFVNAKRLFGDDGPSFCRRQQRR